MLRRLQELPPAEMVLILTGAALVYLLPSIVAALRGHRNGAPVFVVNLFLGWTLIGWVVALAWSLMADQEPARYRARR